MEVRIIMSPVSHLISANALLIDGAVAIEGPIANPGSLVNYAGIVENLWRKGSGGAHMFQKGIAAVEPTIMTTLSEALPKGGGAVRAAKTKIRTAFVSSIKELTPVRTGRLRSSVTDLGGGGGGGLPFVTSSSSMTNLANSMNTRLRTRTR